MPYQSHICCKVAGLRDHGHFIRRIELILRGHLRAVRHRWGWGCCGGGGGVGLGDELVSVDGRAAGPVGDHEHPIKMDNVKVTAQDDNMWRREIRESIDSWTCISLIYMFPSDQIRLFLMFCINNGTKWNKQNWATRFGICSLYWNSGAFNCIERDQYFKIFLVKYVSI